MGLHAGHEAATDGAATVPAPAAAAASSAMLNAVSPPGAQSNITLSSVQVINLEMSGCMRMLHKLCA